ncbi:DUF6376 family protein [Virgibacillus necropolis]|uniref:Lipoprotein n=1 Tax=Virgibacillus necropolis TaxID=163877 RepID=A0A221MGK7_9BACI|nr:DUF6376 family protein [Virgibacillus necropolis]ASN06771.1 hypothetical protein CFK40_17980 [Virgibacillus necropolis]
MKKFISLLLVTTLLSLSGCSFLEEANNSLNYVNESTEYINELSTFAEDTSSLVSEAANNSEAKAELESQLTSLKENIQEYNGIEVPALAEDIHQELKAKNQQLEEAVNQVLQNGEVAIDQLQQSELYQTIADITGLLDQIEQLGL